MKLFKKYYFISYSAHHRQSGVWNNWNDVIDCSPMEFIEQCMEAEEEEKRKGYSIDYRFDKYIILSCTRISRRKFKKYNGTY